jgi:hypothetical protein
MYGMFFDLLVYTLFYMTMDENLFVNAPPESRGQDLGKSKISANQLRLLGWLAITLGFAVVAVGRGVYGQGWFGSISESANFQGTAYILPFVLGGMAVFFWGYDGYDHTDMVLAKIMATSALFTAVFPCDDGVETADAIGVLGLPPAISDAVHSVAAVVLFLSLAVWIGLLFTSTGDKKLLTKLLLRLGFESDTEATRMKILRNRIYFSASILILSGITYVLLDKSGFFENDFPAIWLVEVAMLIVVGFALLVKAGDVWFLNDRRDFRF